MSTFSTEGLILRRRDFRENDSKVTVLSGDFGILDLVVRGTKRHSSKLVAHIEPITVVDIMVVKGKTYDYLGSAIGSNFFLNLKSDSERLYWASLYCRNVLRFLHPGVLEKELYGQILTFFGYLDKEQGDHDYQFAYLAYIGHFLSILGYAVNLDHCAVCKEKLKVGGNFFDFRESLIFCKKCSNKQMLTISDDCVKILRLIQSGNIDFVLNLKIDDFLKKELNKFITSYLQLNMEENS